MSDAAVKPLNKIYFGAETLQMTTETRFAYVQIYADGAQALSLGELVSPGSLTSPPNVNLLGSLGRVAGADPEPGAGPPETFSSLAPSLDNAYLAASTGLSGNGFFDLNNYIYSMTDLSYLCMVNEQAFGQLNKSNCDSPVFDAFIRQRLGQTTDPGEIAAIESDDFQVLPLSNAIQIVGPVWTRQNTFYLGYKLDIGSLSHIWTGTDQFIMEFDAQGAMLGQISSVPFLQRVDDLFGLNQVGDQQRVTYHGREVVSTRYSLNGGRTFTLPLTADRVAGYQPMAPGLNTGPHHFTPIRKPLPPFGRPRPLA